MGIGWPHPVRMVARVPGRRVRDVAAVSSTAAIPVYDWSRALGSADRTLVALMVYDLGRQAVEAVMSGSINGKATPQSRRTLRS